MRRLRSEPRRPRLSRTRTRLPSASSRSTRFVPTKPAPPVTSARALPRPVTASAPATRARRARRRRGRRRPAPAPAGLEGVEGPLPLEPAGDLGHPPLQLDLRLVPEQLARTRDVGEA